MKTTLQERVKDRMVSMGLNNAQLAVACKVKPPTSFNWGSGKTKNIKGEPLLLAAKALGVTPEWLATGLGKKYPETASYATRAEEPPPMYAVAPSPGGWVWPFNKVTPQQYSLLDDEQRSDIEKHVILQIKTREPPEKHESPASKTTKVRSA